MNERKPHPLLLNSAFFHKNIDISANSINGLPREHKKIIARVMEYIFFFTGIMSPLSALEKDGKQDLFQLSLEELGNVVVTPSKSLQLTDNVTQKIDVIDLEEITTTVAGNRNLCEVIARLPGVAVCVLSRNDVNWGTYGGIGPKYSTYMLQGLPIDAFVDPMSLDLNVIDHIEVQRGPASVFYPNYLSQDFAGNQSPLAGTVNLILKQKIERPQTLFQTSYGSYNTLNEQIFQQNRIGRLHYFCGATYEMSDYVDYGTHGSWLNMRKKPEYKKTKAYGGLTYFVNDDERKMLTLFAQKTWHDGDAGRVYREYDNSYGTINAGYYFAITDQLHLQTHTGIRSYDRTWQESKLGTTDIDTLTEKCGVHQIIIPADISLSLHHGDASILSVGADYQEARYGTWIDPLADSYSLGNKSSSLQGGLYIEEELRLFERLTLRGGVHYAYVKNMIDAINGISPEDNYARWYNILWSTGTRYSINKNIGVYANIGNSFLSPGLKSSGGTIRLSDRGVNGRDGQLPNHDLKPERGIGSDAGIEFNLPAQIKAGMRGFYITIEDALVDNIVSRSPSQTQSMNAGTAKSAGGEIEISQKISERVSWFANGTCMTTNIVNDVNTNENDVKIPFSPDVVANIGARYAMWFGFTVTPWLNYTGEFYDGTVKEERTLFKPGVVLNMYASQTIVTGEAYTMECFVQLYNITNNTYEMPWQFQNPGFSGMGGLKVEF
jgi:iron complex outermembrane recepter protein